MNNLTWLGYFYRRTAFRRAFSALFAIAISGLVAPDIFGQTLPALFSEPNPTAADAASAKVKAKKGYTRTRLLKLNSQLLTDATSPLKKGANVAADSSANLILNLFEDSQLPVRVTRTENKVGGSVVVHGFVVGKPQSHVLLSINGGATAGTISMPGEPMVQIVPAANGYTQVGEIAAGDLPPCGTAEVPQPILQRTVTAGDIPAMAGDAPVVVDVMVMYTQAARIAAGGTSAMNALVDLAVEEANTCYSNSAVNLTLNLVYRGEVNYTETANAATDLAALASGSNSQLSSIATLRDTYGADVVTLVTETMDTYSGLGYVMSTVSSGFAPFAFNVVRRQYLTGSYVYPHEVGHNMGCLHDRENATGSGAYDYSYGYRFDASGTTYRTAMAYAPGVRIPYFSNPSVSYGGTPTGVAAGQTNSANNALTINNTSSTVAAFRSSHDFFNFSSTDVTANENDGTISLTVTVSGTHTNAVTVNYATQPGSATAGSDYTTATGTLTFATNETSKTITVTLLNNSVVETNETFKVALSSPTGGPLLGPDSTATITVVDDDIGVTLATSTASVSEDGTNVVLTVNRSGGLTNTVSVDYATVDVSATAGSDYTSTTGTLTFTNGVTSLTVTIPITDDSTVESNETFKFVLSNATGGATIVNGTNVVTIVENDAALGFSTNAVSVSEVATNLAITVTRTGGTNTSMTVDYATADGTATAGSDYTATSGTLTFAPGQKTLTINVPLTNDSTVEGDETFTLSLTNATGGAVLGTSTNLTATILDNDSVFAVSTNAITVSETSGTATISVTRTGGLVGAATVAYATTNGTATAGSDYTAASGILTFAAGETNKSISIKITNDLVSESDETFTVGLGATTGEGTLSTNSVTTVTITDNDSLIGFASSTMSIDEANTNATLTVVRSGTLTLTNTIAYSFKAGSASIADFHGTNGVLTFAPGETNKTIAFAIVDDSLVETNETFQIILASPTGGAAITGTNTATITIVDTDVGLAFSAPTYSASEGAGNVVLTVNRTGATNGTVTVDYATADLSALAGSDYTNTSGTLTFTNGVASQMITVPIIDDIEVETNETFKVVLSNASGAFVVGTTNATVTILENDGTIALSTNAVSVSEVATNLAITVTRTGGTNTSMTVDYATADGTATAGSDYTATSGTLTFAPGQKTLTINVPLTNDSTVEGDETFTLSLTNATGGAVLGTSTNLTATILDNDSVFAVSTNAITVSETSGTATISVTRTGGLVGAATVAYATTNGTATAGSDYTAASGILTFAAGETNKTISIKITNDLVAESDETFTVGLGATTGEGTLSTNAVTTVTITDNDSLIGFAASTMSIDEANTNATLTVVRSGTLTLTNTIAYSFKAGSASIADFHGTNGVLTFAPGETNKTIAFAIVDDSLVETNETFQIILASPTGGAAITGTNTATITIVDTDVGLAFSSPTYSALEGAGNVVLTVNRTGATNGTVTVDYATADLSALAGSDYTNTSGTLTFTNGVASQMITVPIVDDIEVETNETFKVVLSNASGAFVVGTTNATVTILENDGTIALSTNAVSVSEVATNLAITVTRTGGTNTSMTVDYATADGTATAGSDYTATSGTLTFAPGQKTLTINVPLTNDSTVEGDETFTLSLTNATGGAVLGTVTNLTATILDNDSVFAVSTNAITVSETTGTATINVTRTGGLAGAATVAYATTNGTATAGSDYTAASGILTFAAGETNKIISIKITNDLVAESDETFTVGLGATTGEGALSTNTVTTVTITDNDSTIGFETNAVTVAEADGSATLTLIRTGTLTLTNTIAYTFKAGSASIADFHGTNGVVTFAPGETNKSISIPIVNDSVVETNETFSVIISNPLGGAVIGGTNTAYVTIIDDDIGLGLASATASILENAGSLTLTINRTGATNGTVSANYSFTDLTATNGADYLGTNGSISFTNGVTSLTISVPIVDDSVIEANETFKVTLSGFSGAVAGNIVATTVTILEDDSSFAFTTNAVSISEVATNLAVVVRRTGGTNTTASVDYLTADGTATDGSDYTAVNGTLTFQPGQLAQTINIPLTNDTTVEGDETFTLSLTNAVSSVLGTYTNLTATILDNDSIFSVYTNALSVAENVGSATVVVRRTGGVVGAATVQFATANGTATAGSDYASANGLLSFKAGETNKTVSIKVINDTNVEGNEVFTLTLSNPTGEATLSTNATTTITIVDNDYAVGGSDSGIGAIGIAGFAWAPDGSTVLTVTGPLGGYVIMDASSDLKEWTPLAEETIFSGSVQVADPTAATGNRYYRLRPPASVVPGQ